MAKLSPQRRLLKIFHPEGIPWLGTVVYNLVSGASIFQQSYEVIARDILSYCAQGSLLDIGTGPGWLLLKLHQQAPQMRLVGMDVSSAMVAQAQENILAAGLSDVIAVREGNASRIPFADGSFDIVVSTGSIHHWKDPITALNEIHRVLKPDSYALLYDVVSDIPAPILNEMAREFGKLKTVLFWLHGFEEPFYSRQNFERLADSTLFKVGQTKFVSVLCCLILKKPNSLSL
ncbi:MAG: class I SAM-dependent methyltransferase [Chloroflexi bacterium]|nr:class I SAM-dependent methyltransferase [Chloroflexota bacterium]